jgi:dihydrodipicolinate synthase/N-acetylneuraminate lyase
MIQASDIHGVMAMMPAFATDDANSIHAKDTVNVPELERSVDRAVRDGINVITTTGTFGECHTLLWEEFTTLADATVATVDKRIPVVIGCTSLHTREVLLKMDYAAKAGADAVLVGVPFYFKSSVENAVQFYFDLADEHPELGIFIYHNPRNHHIQIPVSAFKELVTKPNIVGMKDSHRTPMQFMQLMDTVRGKISVMTNQNQMYPYMMMGAAGCWSINAWMGPSPVIRAYQAGREGRWDEVREICMAMARVGGRDPSLTDPVEGKLSINEAGYCYAGPGRPPFRVTSDQTRAEAKAIAQRWRKLCETYPLPEEAAA